MTTRHHGNPCWYELATSRGNLQAAEDFYRTVFGWKVSDAGMQGFDYRLAEADDDTVAGLMSMPEEVSEIPPFWMIYFAVDDADDFVADAMAAGAQRHRGPSDIPGTGRFALLADPQGAGFGILQPEMSGTTDEDLAKVEAGTGAFNENKPAHGQAGL